MIFFPLVILENSSLMWNTKIAYDSINSILLLLSLVHYKDMPLYSAAKPSSNSLEYSRKVEMADFRMTTFVVVCSYESQRDLLLQSYNFYYCSQSLHFN